MLGGRGGFPVGPKGSVAPVGWILDHCVFLPAPRAVWPAVRPVWPCCLRAAAVLPRGKCASRCQCRCTEAATGTGLDWMCSGRVRDMSGMCPALQSITPRYWDSQGWDSRVLAAVPALLHHPGCGAEISHPPGDMPPRDEAPTHGITC